MNQVERYRKYLEAEYKVDVEWVLAREEERLKELLCYFILNPTQMQETLAFTVCCDAISDAGYPISAISRYLEECDVVAHKLGEQPRGIGSGVVVARTLPLSGIVEVDILDQESSELTKEMTQEERRQAEKGFNCNGVELYIDMSDWGVSLLVNLSDMKEHFNYT